MRRVVEAAPTLGIEVLTLYAFSSDNWERPRGEVQVLMQLFRRFLSTEAANCLAQQVRLNVIGRRDRLGAGLDSAIRQAERLTAPAGKLIVRIALDYSSRDAILAAATSGHATTRQQFSRDIEHATHSLPDIPGIDLLIRTGEERRLSDFLLWECAYAELYFSDALWPDFDEGGLQLALADYRRRERRFGRIPVSAAG